MEASWNCHWVSVYERLNLPVMVGTVESRGRLAHRDLLAEGAFMKSDSHSCAPILVDLFCGAGGLSTGLEQAGFRPILGLDYDRHAIATYAKNHPGTVALHKDVSKVTAKELLAAADGKEIDLIAGGPSCQGYSTHGKRIEDDPQISFSSNSCAWFGRCGHSSS